MILNVNDQCMCQMYAPSKYRVRSLGKDLNKYPCITNEKCFTFNNQVQESTILVIRNNLMTQNNLLTGK